MQTHFKIPQKQTSIKTEVQKEVANKKIITTKQKTRNRKKGGWLYLFENPFWRDKHIAKFGSVEEGNSGRDWEDRMKEHQHHYPIHRIVLLELIYVPYDIKRFENSILAKFQNIGLQYKTAATSTSEYTLMNIEEKDIKDIILNELTPEAEDQKATMSLWNNVIISEEEQDDNENATL